MNMILIALENISRFAIRFFPYLVAACLLIFPAYKGIWPGYIPVVSGLVFTMVFYRKQNGISECIGSWSNCRLFLILLVLPATIQIMLILVIQSVPMYDGLFVVRHAETLVTTGRMDPLTYYPPLQTWWYAAWFKLFGSSAVVAQLSHIPLSAGVTWLVYRTAKYFGSEKHARMVGLAAAWYPSFVSYVLTTPYYHYLYTLLMVWMVHGLLRGAATFPIQKSTFNSQHSTLNIQLWKYWGVAGVAAGLGSLTKGTQLIAPLQVVTWLVILGCVTKVFPWRRMIGGMIVFLIGMMLALGPWTIRNWYVFNDVVPVCTSGGLVMYSANNPTSNGLYSDIPDTVALQTPAEMLAHTRWCSDQARDFIRNHPKEFANLAWRKFLHTWGVEATFAELIHRKDKPAVPMQHAFSFLFLTGWASLVAAWALKSFLLARQRSPLSAYELLAGVLILSNALVYVVFEGGDRHHLPLVPLILLYLMPCIGTSDVGTADRK